MYKKIIIILSLLLLGFRPASMTGLDIQTQLDSISGRNFGDTLYLEQGVWEITEPLRINEREGVTIVGAGSSLSGTVLKCNTPGRACIEIIGSNNIILQNINITGIDMAVGVITGRSVDNLNSSQIVGRDVYIYGQYDFAAWYNVSSESNRFENVHFNAQNPDAESVVTIAGRNIYGVSTDVELSENIGGFMLISQSGLTGKAKTSLKIDGVLPVKVTDSYLYNAQNAAIEVNNGRSLIVVDTDFEGATQAAINILSGTLEMKINSKLGNAQYAIYADDGTTIKNSEIGNTGLKPLHFDVLVHTDLSNWGVYDSRVRVINAGSCFAVHVRLGQNDKFNCVTKKGVVVENQSSLWNPIMEYQGFVE